ncbi:caspase, EACC1-associated type [Saccharothrix variisporea]|uniref:Caspase domain-containing protein n=1 Tax=Saccharothrix variisporea TaxID=543527 RepID=A0A495X1B1_9PSEU|nr:caspase family protein [Saccharothrix variisporea]RKT67710.1 caspase domain-containing protein [Saccharothrix variisporea]
MRTALLIATDTYTDPTFRALRAPALDAVELDRVLADPAIGEFRTEVLLNRPAQEVRQRVDEVFATAGVEDLVLLYLSGHGVKDQTGALHFAATDTRHDLLPSTSVSAQFVRQVIDRSRASRVVVWLDCCYGGAFPSGMTPRAGGDVDVVEQLDDGRGCVVMTASTHIQYAYEPDGSVHDEAQPSVFTRAIVEGLRTGAADLDGDGAITTRDLYAYVYERLRRESPDQTPTTSGVVAGDLRIARVGTPLPAGLPDELRRLVRSADPALREEGVRLLRARTDPVSAEALRMLAAGEDRDLAVAAGAMPSLPTDPPPSPVFAGHAQLLRYAGGAPAFSPDSSLLAAGVTVWDTVSWRSVGPVRLDGNSFAFSPDGRLLAVDKHPGASLYSTASWTSQGQVAQPSDGHLPSTGRLAFSFDGRTLVRWRFDRPPTLWVAVEDQWQHRPLHLGRVLSAHVAATAPRMVTLTVDSEVQVWNTSTRRPIGTAFRTDPPTRAVALSPDGKLLAAANATQTSLLRTGDRSVVTTLPGGVWWQDGLAFSADGRLLTTAGRDGVRVWSVPTGRLRQTIDTELRDVVFSPDGRLMAGVTRNGGVWLWATDPDDLRPLPAPPPLPPTAALREEKLDAAGRPASVGAVSAFAVGFGLVLLIAGLSWVTAALALAVGLGSAFAVGGTVLRVLTR